MARSVRAAVLLSVSTVVGASAFDGSAKLDLEVRPAVSLEPAFITVSARVAADDRNRSLEIVAESEDYYRSSRIDLDGARAPRVFVFDFPNLPTGDYEVRAVLASADKRETAISRAVKVAAAPGSGERFR